MSQLVEQTKRVIETYTIPKYIVDDLISYAKEHNEKKSQIVAKALEAYFQKQNPKTSRRLEALDRLIGIADGQLVDIDKESLRQMRADRYGQ